MQVVMLTGIGPVLSYQIRVGGPMASRPIRWALQGGMLALSVTLALLLGEGLARLVLDPGDYLMATPVSDPILGRRLEPGASGHDQWGFRNREVPHRADVVTIGDSQTYGVGLPLFSSWPAQLSQLTRLQVYNAALPGYSVVQYHELLRRYALQLKPSAVVVGFYFGNDLLEAYRIVYARPYYAALRRADVPPVQRRVPTGSSRKRSVRVLKRWLSVHSVLYRVALSSVLKEQGQRAELILGQDGDDVLRLHHGTSSTAFTPAGRLRALDLDSPRVREGLRLSLLQFELMAQLCDSAGVAFFIALLPTKERVYQPLIEADPELRQHPALRELLAQEGEVDQRVRRFLHERGISYIDLLSPLQDAVRHTPIYPPNDDGHPTAAGYAVIAQAVARAIAEH
jgi:lysophospholipase L1-like esterase